MKKSPGKLADILLYLLYTSGCVLPCLSGLEIGGKYVFFACTAVILFFCFLKFVLTLPGRKIRVLSSAGLLIAAALAVLVIPGMRNNFLECVFALQARYNGISLPLVLISQKAAVLLCIFICLLVLQFTSPVGIMALITALIFSTEQIPTLVWAPMIASVIMIFVRSAWTKFSGSSGKIVPGRVFALICAVVLAFSAVLPQDAPVSPKLKAIGDSVREKIRDTFFFTSTRNVFSLANEGYYPQGISQMGGKPEIRNDNVMMVMTPEVTYLRGVIKDNYNGRCWNETRGSRRFLWSSNRWSNERQAIFNMNIPGESITRQSRLFTPRTVSVKMLTSATSTLYVPQRIISLHPGGTLTPYFNKASEVYITHDLQPGDTYSVTASLFTGGEAGLGTIINAAKGKGDPELAEIRQIYLQLPGHIQSEVYQLCDRITSGASTDYDKAVAIKNYLSRNFRYTTDVENQPENQDFVTTFLLASKEGYCVHFATAMTIMARMAGLPARYIEGYLVRPDENGHAVVTGEDAHAWCEIYFDSFGWVTFDATPVFADSTSGESPDDNPPDEEENDSEEDDSPTPPPDEDDNEEQPQITPPPENEENDPEENHEPIRKKSNFLWLWLLVILLVLAGIAARIWMVLPQNRSRKKDRNSTFRIYSDALYTALSVLGTAREIDESPAAFFSRTDISSTFETKLLPFGLAESRIIYGKKDCTEGDVKIAVSSYDAVFRSMKPYQKAVLLLHLAFVPGMKSARKK